MQTVVHRIVSGKWRQNGYVIEGADRNALIVDPGMDTSAFASLIAERGLAPCAILNTHAHYDHIGSVCALMEAHGTAFYLHKSDAALLRQANLYRAMFDETAKLRIPQGFTDLSELTELALGNLGVEVISTPGHTAGSVCFRLGDLLFTGDTLLSKGPGRTDLPGGSAAQMALSQQLLAALPDHLLVHPGHGSIVPMRQVRELMKAA